MEKKLSAEEVLKKYTFSNILPYSEWLHNAMEEYASQFKGEAVSDAISVDQIEAILYACFFDDEADYHMAANRIFNLASKNHKQ